MHSLLAATTLPVPSDYRAGTVSMWLFTLWAGGFALLVLPYVLYRLRKHRDTVLLFTWIGGFICSLGEPMLDHTSLHRGIGEQPHDLGAMAIQAGTNLRH